MANSLYTLGRKAFGDAGIAWLSDTIKVECVTTSYTPNLSTDQYQNVAIAGGNVIGSAVALGTKTNVGGTLGAANTVFTAVTGAQFAYLAIYKDVSGSNPLIGLIDTGTGLPCTPNGGDITVAWSSGNIVTLFEGLSQDAIDHILANLPEAPRDRSEWRGWVRDVLERMRGVFIPPPQIVVTGRPLLIG
jgi:hypothetical protein